MELFYSTVSSRRIELWDRRRTSGSGRKRFARAALRRLSICGKGVDSSSASIVGTFAKGVVLAVASDAHELSRLFDDANTFRFPGCAQFLNSVRERAIRVVAGSFSVMGTEAHLVLQAVESHVPSLATAKTDERGTVSTHEHGYRMRRYGNVYVHPVRRCGFFFLFCCNVRRHSQNILEYDTRKKGMLLYAYPLFF